MMVTGPVIIDVPVKVQEFHEAPVAFDHQNRGDSFFPDPRERALPEDLKKEIHQFQVNEVALKFFRNHRRVGLFSRQKVDFESLASFQTDPLKAPLLLTHSKGSAKLAIDCFKLILTYTGADPKAKAGQSMTVNRLVSHLVATEELRDEIFFQLVKQTRGNPTRICLLKTWELFLMCATLIPATRNSEQSIKGHLYQTLKDSDPVIADIAQFTYIRLNTRCIIGKPATDIGIPVIQQIPKDVSDGHQVFGASIYEQLWHQRKTHPRAPIPISIHRMAEAIIEKGGERWEGIFRLPGSSDKIARMQKTINGGGDPIPLADMNDLASLFKSWFAKLPEPIVNADFLPLLRTAWETKNYPGFTEELPGAYVGVLKYLVGFLRRIAAAEEGTKMTPRNLAICFAPNLVDSRGISDPKQMQEYSEMSQEFLVSLITSWDTSDLSPPQDGIMVPA
jgi:hypothetical protein